MDSRIVPQVGNNRSIPSADYHAVARRKGAKWLGPYTGKTEDLTEWECPKGHRIWVSYANYKKDTYGCSICGCKQPEDYYELAQMRGYEWLGPYPRVSSDKTWWICPDGHRYYGSYHSLRSGKGCRICGNKRKGVSAKLKNEFDYFRLGIDKGFEWLGPFPDGVMQKTLWRCRAEHEFLSTYNMIYQGKGCPHCAGTFVNGFLASSTQIKIGEMLKGQVNRVHKGKAIDVVVNRSGIDIAIEFDAWYWHGSKQEVDQCRISGLLADGWRVLRIKGAMKPPTKRQCNDAIRRLVAGEKYVEIVLPGWGVGDTWHDVKARGFPKVPK